MKKPTLIQSFLIYLLVAFLFCCGITPINIDSPEKLNEICSSTLYIRSYSHGDRNCEESTRCIRCSNSTASI